MLKKIYFSVFLLPLNLLGSSPVSEIDYFADGERSPLLNDQNSEIDLLPGSAVAQKKKKPPFPGCSNDGNQTKENHGQISNIPEQMPFFILSNHASPTRMMESGSNMFLSKNDHNSVLISRKEAALFEEGPALQTQQHDDDDQMPPLTPLKKRITQNFSNQNKSLLRENHFSDESVRAFNQEHGSYLSYTRNCLHREISSANSINEEQENQQRDLNANQKALNTTQQQGVNTQQGIVTKFSNINFTESTMGLGQGMPSTSAFEDSDDE